MGRGSETGASWGSIAAGLGSVAAIPLAVYSTRFSEGGVKVRLVDKVFNESVRYVDKDFFVQAVQGDYELTIRVIIAQQWPHRCKQLMNAFQLVQLVIEANQSSGGAVCVVDR